MCGIAGTVGMEDRKMTGKMCDAIEHRGPDSEGIYSDKNVCMGVKRLRIIDPDGGDQPMFNEDGSICVVFNGEIYNYQELKEDMEKRGHRFNTVCDTEVLVHLYEEFGDLFPLKLNGMFAFAIWDSSKGKLLLARDRLGIKPLYYSIIDKKLLFASEIKSILQYDELERAVNLRALHNFLTLQYVPAPDTMFRGIKKLTQGHILIHRNGKNELLQYWDLPPSKPMDIYTEDFISGRVLELLTESVGARLMSDVPLGVYLSGGVDSSTIVALASKLSDEPVKTFSVGFETDNTNELCYANTVAEHFGTDHHELMCEVDAIKTLPKIIWHQDEPTADPAAVPTYLMSELTKKHVTVVLAGEGGDENFGGYDEYKHLLYGNRYHRIIPKFLFRQFPHITKFIPDIGNLRKYFEFAGEFVPTLGNKAESYYISTCIFKDDEKRQLLRKEYDFPKTRPNFDVRNDFLAEMCRYNIKNGMADDLLMKVDKMSMAHSLEARVPFLDHTLVEFSNKIPSRLKLMGMTEKYILRRAVKDILPRVIVKRKKHGFNVPLSTWFRGELRKYAADTFLESAARRRKYFNYNFIGHLLEHPEKLKYDRKLWLLMNFEIWHKIYIGGD